MTFEEDTECNLNRALLDLRSHPRLAPYVQANNAPWRDAPVGNIPRDSWMHPSTALCYNPPFV